MAVMNLTPDSFFAASRVQSGSHQEVLDTAASLIESGADLLDLGGMSSRPGAAIIEESEELDRVMPALEAVLKSFPDVPVSVDTVRSGVARAALEAGAAMINDISGGELDPGMLETVGRFDAPYILMHMQGKPADMQQAPSYSDVVTEVFDYLQHRVTACRAAGIKDVILDPGFGFGKTLEHNYGLLANFSAFRQLGCPLLAGISRKSMVYRLLGVKPEDALHGSTVAHTLALLGGAAFLRVHDPLPARQAIEVLAAYQAHY